MKTLTTQQSVNYKHKIFKDLWYSVFYKIEEHHVEFFVYEVNSFGDKDIPYYEKLHGEKSHCVDGIAPFAYGHVKWDGCSNWSFPSQEECMIHHCTQEGLLNIGKILSECWSMAEKELPTFDK